MPIPCNTSQVLSVMLRLHRMTTAGALTLGPALIAALSQPPAAAKVHEMARLVLGGVAVSKGLPYGAVSRAAGDGRRASAEEGEVCGRADGSGRVESHGSSSRGDTGSNDRGADEVASRSSTERSMGSDRSGRRGRSHSRSREGSGVSKGARERSRSPRSQSRGSSGSQGRADGNSFGGSRSEDARGEAQLQQCAPPSPRRPLAAAARKRITWPDADRKPQQTEPLAAAATPVPPALPFDRQQQQPGAGLFVPSPSLAQRVLAPFAELPLGAMQEEIGDPRKLRELCGMAVLVGRQRGGWVVGVGYINSRAVRVCACLCAYSCVFKWARYQRAHGACNVRCQLVCWLYLCVGFHARGCPRTCPEVACSLSLSHTLALHRTHAPP
jgi:hypothetical protein